jgi:hypothetical protein
MSTPSHTEATVETKELDTRAINIRIASEVMGWHSVWVRGYHTGHFTGEHYASAEACAADCVEGQRPVHLWANGNESTFGKGEENWNPSADISAAWEVLAQVKMWIFSKRMAFKRALQKEISARLGCGDALSISPEEIILRVEPVDICIAALNATRAKDGG